MSMGRAGLLSLLAGAAAMGAGEPPPEPGPSIRQPREPGQKRVRHRHKPRIQRVTLAKRLEWDRAPLIAKTFPKDLHPHIRKREELKRSLNSPLKGMHR